MMSEFHHPSVWSLPSLLGLWKTFHVNKRHVRDLLSLNINCPVPLNKVLLQHKDKPDKIKTVNGVVKTEENSRWDSVWAMRHHFQQHVCAWRRFALPGQVLVWHLSRYHPRWQHYNVFRLVTLFSDFQWQQQSKDHRNQLCVVVFYFYFYTYCIVARRFTRY